MTITSRDQLIDAMANRVSRLILDKASISGLAAGNFVSLWRATGQPGQGAIPTTVAACDHNLVGSFQFSQQTAPTTSYLSLFESVCSVAATTLEIHDRLAHFGGLSGTLTTAQTVSLDLSALLGSLNINTRRGDANYSDVQWWMEWYTATGATAVTATVNVTFNDSSTNNLAAIALAATRPASFMLPLNGLIQAADSGKYIMAINSVTLSASTLTAGNFGFTATRYRAALFNPVANARFTQGWAELGLPELPNSSCLFAIIIAAAAAIGTIRGTGKVSHG